MVWPQWIWGTARMVGVARWRDTDKPILQMQEWGPDLKPVCSPQPAYKQLVTGDIISHAAKPKPYQTWEQEPVHVPCWWDLQGDKQYKCQGPGGMGKSLGRGDPVVSSPQVQMGMNEGEPQPPEQWGREKFGEVRASGLQNWPVPALQRACISPVVRTNGLCSSPER